MAQTGTHIHVQLPDMPDLPNLPGTSQQEEGEQGQAPRALNVKVEPTQSIEDMPKGLAKEFMFYELRIMNFAVLAFLQPDDQVNDVGHKMLSLPLMRHEANLWKQKMRPVETKEFPNNNWEMQAKEYQEEKEKVEGEEQNPDEDVGSEEEPRKKGILTDYPDDQEEMESTHLDLQDRRKLGPIDVLAQLFPEDKVELLKQLKAAGLTGMVGDGINDAQALAAVDVGISMGVAAVGYASLWGAVLADLGTYLLVIFNSKLLLESKKDESGCQGLFAFRRKRRSKVCQKDVLLSSEKGANNGMRQRVNNRVACEKDCQCIAIDEGLLVSSDAANVGSEVRDSLLGGSSEGDVESVRYQELASYAPAHGIVRSQDFSSKEGRHVEVESAPIHHLDEHEDERDMILQYYSEEWGHSKESSQMDVTGRGQGLLLTGRGQGQQEAQEDQQNVWRSKKTKKSPGGLGPASLGLQMAGWARPCEQVTGLTEVCTCLCQDNPGNLRHLKGREPWEPEVLGKGSIGSQDQQ
ncbi:hypothetical protein L7F22_021044 [Adiantum nelumboides]|nr:hypothetical protein [Adiantum nelumboides]